MAAGASEGTPPLSAAMCAGAQPMVIVEEYTLMKIDVRHTST
jgi:hypothetical protein